MKQRARIYYTETDKALMWDHWQNGESLHSIARLFDRHHSAIQGILSRTGGIRPPARRRSRFALTLAEREEISRGVVTGTLDAALQDGIGTEFFADLPYVADGIPKLEHGGTRNYAN